MNNELMNEQTVVLYHAGCVDGFAAAFAACKKYGSLADYIPVSYGSPAIDGRGQDIIMVDFSYPPSELAALAERANSVVVIDHHAAAIQGLQAARGADNLTLILDTSRSGCVLAWESFFPDVPVPGLFLYVQDQDLWQWKLPNSRAVFAGISVEPFEFPAWANLLADTDIATLADRGEVILKYQDMLVKAAIEHATMGYIGGYYVPCVNSTVLPNEVAEAIYTNHPFAAVWYDAEEGRKFSLRSHPETGIDVNTVARMFGGGGHPHAAGFRVPKV